MVRRILREERRVVVVESGLVRVVEVWVADDALGGVGGAEGMKKEGMQAMVD